MITLEDPKAFAEFLEEAYKSKYAKYLEEDDDEEYDDDDD